MSNRDTILSKIENTLTCIQKSDIEVADGYRLKLLGLQNDIKNFRLYLPLIGSFNAGKSSLINAYLHSNEFLPTNIIPETTLATELYYAPDEKIEVCKFESQTPIKVIDSLDFSAVDTDEADYLKVYIHSDELRKHDIILVDMAGLDSNIKRHNQSILGYMSKDVSFVLVVNIEDGTVRHSTLSFLKEIKDYRLDFFTLLNKADKKLPKEIEEIKRHITHQLSSLTQEPFVGSVSALDGEIEDFQQILHRIHVDEYIQKLYNPKTDDVIDAIIFDLMTRRDSIALDFEEIDQQISQLLSHMRKIHQELESEKRKVENTFSQTLLSEILEDVENTLRLHIESLIQSLETSNETLNSTINELIRPVIVSKIKNYSEKIFVETIHNIEISNRDILSTISSQVDKAHSTIATVKTVLPILPEVLRIVVGKVLTKINPILVVLSTVVSVVSHFFGETKEEKEVREAQQRREAIREQLQNRVIPSIPNQIAPSIQKSLDQIKDDFFVELKRTFDEQIENMQNSLNSAKKEKADKRHQIEEQREKYTQLINSLKYIIGEK